ncbi:MAG: YggS family pyridoxal phosphate-dependent enzyme [Bacteroidaceae bacterium]|nr:YggS family pyridoxal phosphate-dependent enzyme [Bacteroidaceae bacterium]
MTTIGQNYQQILTSLPSGVALTAVSKFHPVAHLQAAYDAGCRVFGESRVQELVGKHEVLPHDIQWHFIGHLQPNKVKYIAPFVSLIHAVDTPKLLAEIHRRAEANKRLIPCLLQVHIAREETKFGFTPEELLEYLDQGSWRKYSSAQISGLMCMASNTDDMGQVRAEFQRVKSLFDTIKTTFFANDEAFRLRSYGMSHDWHEAVAAGSNIVRIGTSIFGERT